MYFYNYIFLNCLLEIFFTDLTPDLDFDKYAYLDIYFYLNRFYFLLKKIYLYLQYSINSSTNIKIVLKMIKSKTVYIKNKNGSKRLIQ